MYKPIPKEIKEEVLHRIKNKGVSVSDAAKDAGISTNVIYAWLAKETTKTGVSAIEFNRLKKENEALYKIVGKLTCQMDQVKKGRWPK